MKYLFLIVLLFSSVAYPIAKKTIDSNFDKKIIGIWAEGIDENGKFHFYNTYFENGKLHGYGYTDPEDKSSYFFADAKWEIKGNNSCITIIYSSNDTFTAGDYWCDKIIKMDRSVFIYNSGGENVTMFRVTDGKHK